MSKRSIENHSKTEKLEQYGRRQNHDELEHFCTNFDLLLSNINNLYSTCSIVLGDFNAKCSKWCASDKSNTTGIELDNITMTSGYNQMIDKPTHYINESSSCIDLIFSSNVNLTKNCGVEQSLYEKCRHNIIYGTLNFNILLPPPYYRELWDFKSANTECIQKSISNFSLGLGFSKSKLQRTMQNIIIGNIIEYIS